jgi:hypothetical protein
MRAPPVLVVLVVAATLLSSTSALAHKKFARRYGVECKECHESAAGGGPRNLIGQYFQATNELPIDRSPQTMKLVESTVDRWMLEVLSKPPTIRWRHTPVTALPDAEPKPVAVADDATLLRRISLDVRGTTPTERDLEFLQKGRALDSFIDEWLESKDFESTFFLYHKDIIRPRTGIFNTPVSWSRVTPKKLEGVEVWSSERLRTELSSGACARDKLVEMSPWWDRTKTLKVCAQTARVDATAEVRGKTVRCDSEEGQLSGACGCGKNMVFCYVDAVKDDVMTSMKNELSQLAMTVVKEDRPYSEILTSDWTMLDGKLEVYYGKLWGDQVSIADPDARKPWRKYDRDPRHSGMLSSPVMLNFFYNGRRWAQRTFEAFFCHDTVPDFDLLDDTLDAGEQVAVPYRDSPDLMPTQSVTEGRACAACHLQLDSIARVKDRWDYFGGYHETMSSDRKLPIPQEVIFEGKVIDGMNGLGEALAASPVFHDCAANQAWDHLLGHRFRPDEVRTRKRLVADFQASGLKFKPLLKAILRSPEYRAKENIKLMKKEQYVRAMGRATDVAWKVGDKSGWELYYDKVGGMDYRKIEFRDIRPGIGHSLVQFKAAGESCHDFVDREAKRSQKERLWLSAVDEVDAKPKSAELDDVLKRLYARALTRPWDDVPEEERSILRELFADAGGGALGYKAVCTAIFGGADYALY